MSKQFQQLGAYEVGGNWNTEAKISLVFRKWAPQPKTRIKFTELQEVKEKAKRPGENTCSSFSSQPICLILSWKGVETFWAWKISISTERNKSFLNNAENAE